MGRRWQGQGTAFTGKNTQVDCTLLGCWAAGHQTAWLVLTGLPPHTAQVCWYGLRAWIEPGFKRLKSGGWQWPYTRMDDPSRAERLWVALAIAAWLDEQAALTLEYASSVEAVVDRLAGLLLARVLLTVRTGRRHASIPSLIFTVAVTGAAPPDP